MSKIYSFEELTDSVELLERKPPRFIGWFLGGIILFLTVFFVWTYFGTIDIVSKGTAIVHGKSDVDVIRSQVGGTVNKIKVHSGDYVRKGDTLIQVQNQELEDKRQQLGEILQKLELEKSMLDQLKNSIQDNKSSFNGKIDDKVLEEYKAYEQGYNLLKSEKKSEVDTIERVPDELDENLNSFIKEKENIQSEYDSLNEQQNKKEILKEQRQVIGDKLSSLRLQKDTLTKRIEDRKSYLENQRKKMDQIKKDKELQVQQSLKQYQQNAVVSVNQRIQSIEQEYLVKKQEYETLNHQYETTNLKAKRDGITQFSSNLQEGDLIELGQEIVSVVPKESNKKIKLFLSAQDVKDIKKGDKVQYSFKLHKSDKQVGTISYIAAYPTFNKDLKSYVYELEATINTKELKQLQVGMIGKASVITGSDPVWKFILKKLDFISN
ncbi:HlyD family secretion protein [Bacillus cytotoxicus]|uniref:HlyD family secretion protein n=1 Tax=Bacillus cytotoxicus TaxID=580165 RepID=A0ACC6AAJ8_9BACI|nr:HlyD family secretion protein [Bacillus cytotoxicus]